MKVWELIAELMKRPAGAEVKVGTPWTQYASVYGVSDADDNGAVGIDAEESECVNEDGDDVGMLGTIVNGK